MKKTSKLSVVIFGICAAIWSLKTILDIVDKIYSVSVLTFAMDVICVILWIAEFIIQLKKFCKEKKQ